MNTKPINRIFFKYEVINNNMINRFITLKEVCMYYNITKYTANAILANRPGCKLSPVYQIKRVKVRISDIQTFDPYRSLIKK